MPGKDQTGPADAGAMTGRKRGRCAEQENSTPAGRGLGRGGNRGQR